MSRNIAPWLLAACFGVLVLILIKPTQAAPAKAVGGGAAAAEGGSITFIPDTNDASEGYAIVVSNGRAFLLRKFASGLTLKDSVDLR